MITLSFLVWAVGAGEAGTVFATAAAVEAEADAEAEWYRLRRMAAVDGSCVIHGSKARRVTTDGTSVEECNRVDSMML